MSGEEAEFAIGDFESRRRNLIEFDRRFKEWKDVVSSKPQAETDEADDAVSTRSRSSRSSTRSVISVKRREARVKAEMAKLKKQQMVQAQVMTLQRVKIEQELAAKEAENEIRNAEVEYQLWGEELGIEDNLMTPHVKSESNYVNAMYHNDTVPKGDIRMLNEDKVNSVEMLQDKVKHSNGNDSDKENGLTKVMQALGLSVNMPKPEISSFEGNPLGYWNFINNFDVARKATDDRARLTYLIQFCTGKARASIETCVLLEASQGYAEARRILKEQFGQPHVISRAHLQKVLNRPQIKPNDSAGMWDLSRDMNRCEAVLSPNVICC